MWRPNECDCRCCCCTGEKSTWPEILNLAATFSGTPIAGCFASPITAELIRHECPKTIIQQTLTLYGAEDEPYEAQFDIDAEYFSRPVNVGGTCGTAVFAIAPFYTAEGGDTTSHVPALWIIHESGGVAFKLYEGVPLLKKTSAISACTPELVLNRLSPTEFITAPVNDSWATIAAAMFALGWFSDYELFFAESFANGWDIATLAIAGDEIIITSQNATVCDPDDFNFVGELAFNNRFHGGQAKWAPSTTGFTATQTVTYESAYGFCVRYLETPMAVPGGGPTLTAGSSYYYAPTSPSFFHGNAPFAALATTRLGTHGPSWLFGLTCRATIVTPADAAQHPKGFPEAIGETACSDCAGGMVVTPTTPTKSGTPVTGYNTAARAVDLQDCLQCPPDISTPALKNATGATYNKQEIVNAAISAMTVKRNWTLTTPDTPPATFTLTLNGQTTSPAISTTASAATIQSAIEGLSNVVPGDVICGDGPLPAAVSLEWTGNFETPAAITFTGNSGIVLTCLSQRADVARFTSDAAVDTNYEGTDHLSYTKTTAVLTTPDRTRFVTVADDDDEPPLLFPDGADLVKADCVEQYRNCPYESVVAEVSGIAYPIGGKADVFSPADNWFTGATMPVDTVGSVDPPDAFDIGLTVNCQVGTGLQGGAAGLTYQAVPADAMLVGKYLSVSGATLYEGAVFGVAPIGAPYTITNTYETHKFSTILDRTNYLSVLNICNGSLSGAASFGMSLFNRAHIGYLTYVDASPTEYTKNGCASTTGPCTAIYEKFTQADKSCIGVFSPAPDPFSGEPADSGVLAGAFTNLDYVGCKVKACSVSINPCGSTVTCRIEYWVYYWKRVPITIEGEWDTYHRNSTSDPWVFVRSSGFHTHRSYYQYGFIEPRVATFSSPVSTDLCLRPNLDKTRIITLAFDSDDTLGSEGFPDGCFIHAAGTIGDRAFINNWNSQSEITIEPMPDAGQWATITTSAEDAVLPLIAVGTEFGAASPSLDKTVITANGSAIGTMVDPSSIATPNIIDWSGATVAVTMSPGFGAHDIVNAVDTFRYRLPASFPVDWAGEHELLADTNEPQWVEEVADAPFVKAMLSPYDWTLTLFEADCSEPVVTQVVPAAGLSGRAEPRRVVARYRLPCNQRQRFDVNGVNTLELISCDRTVADWPLTLKVQP